MKDKELLKKMKCLDKNFPMCSKKSKTYELSITRDKIRNNVKTNEDAKEGLRKETEIRNKT